MLSLLYLQFLNFIRIIEKINTIVNLRCLFHKIVVKTLMIIYQIFSRYQELLTELWNPVKSRNTPDWKYITFSHYLLYYTDGKLGQLDNRINIGWRQGKWTLWEDQPNTHGKITKTIEVISSELKTNPVVKKLLNYVNKLLQHIRWLDRDRQTVIFNYEISTVWETKTRTTN